MILNPVLGREIKERMRSRRAVVMLIAFLGLLALILYLTYRAGLLMLNDRFSPLAGTTASLGRLMFEWLLFFLIMFVAFIAPGVAAGSIVGERERRTLHPLQVTLLSPRSIVVGKLGASMAYVTLLVLATAPLFAVPLVLGGVSPWQVMRGFVVILALEVALASLATLMSAVAKRVQFAIVAAYGLALLLLAGTGILLGAELLWRSQETPNRDITHEALAIYLNPVAAVADAVTDPAAPDLLPTPLSALGSYTRDRQLSGLRQNGMVAFGDEMVFEATGDEAGAVEIVDGGGRIITRGGRGRMPMGEPLIGGPAFGDHRGRRAELPAFRLWMFHVGFLLWISFGALWLASRRLRTPVVKMMKVRHKK